MYLQLDRVAAGDIVLEPLGHVRYELRSAQQRDKLQPSTIVTLSGALFPASRSASSLGQRFMDTADPEYAFAGRITRVERPTQGPFEQVRATVRSAIRGVVPGSEADLLLGVVFGDTQPSPQLKQTFLAAGLLHVLAASGANVWILEGAAEFVMYPMVRRVPGLRTTWNWAVIAGVWGFAQLCGNTPSIVRAAWMSTYRRVGIAFGRRPLPALGLAWAAVAMCVAHPEDGFSVSTWLSFTATAAVLRAWAGIGKRRSHQTVPDRNEWRQWSARLVQNSLAGVWISIRVAWAILPLEIGFFRQVTPYAVVANVFSEPLLALLLPVALMTLLTAVIAQVVGWMRPLAKLCGLAASAGATALQQIASWIAGWPGALQTLQVGGGWWITAAVLWWLSPFVATRARVWWRRAAATWIWHQHRG